jgi:hypothetical protein
MAVEYMARAAVSASSSECTYMAIVKLAVACPSPFEMTAVGTPRRCSVYPLRCGSSSWTSDLPWDGGAGGCRR